MARNDYKWNTDSRDERQSDYSPSGYATTGFDSSHEDGAKRRALRKRNARLTWLLPVIVAIVLLSAAVLYGASKLLRS
jgi:hypothetical protein